MTTDRVLPPMPVDAGTKVRWPFGRSHAQVREQRWRERVAELNQRSDDLLAQEQRLRDYEHKLREKKVSLQKWELELTQREHTVRQLTSSTVFETAQRGGFLGLDGNAYELQDGVCPHCDTSVTLMSFRVFRSDTRRKRKTYLCSEECAYDFDQSQRDLIEGEDYVRQSLGMTS